MDERRGGAAGTRSVYDRHPAWRWVDAAAWLGEFRCRSFTEEPYQDNAAFLVANPCVEYWCIGTDFDIAITTLVANWARSAFYSDQMAEDYLHGLMPPAWSRCAKFLEAGLAAGDFHDIAVETDASVDVSFRRLFDDMPVNPGDRWGETPKGPDGGGVSTSPLRIEMAHWLDGISTLWSVGEANQYMELNPPDRFWALGWEFDRALLRRLAGELASCEEPYWLNELSTVLRIPDSAKDVSLVERLRVDRARFLDAREFEWDFLEGRPDDYGDPAAIVRATFGWERLSDLIDEEDASIDEVLALGDALEPPTGSDTWALLSTRLEEMAPPGTSWKDLAKAHPWLADAHWSAAEEERARLWYGAYCWCERLVMQVRGINPPCESLEVFFRDNPADGYWDLGEPFDLLVTSQLVERYQKLEPVGACARADSKMMTVRMVDADHSPDGDRRKGRDEVASISTLVNAPAGTLTEAWLADVEEAESVERECPPPDGLNEYIRRLLISECGYGGSEEEIPVGITCGALTLVHTKMLEACRGSDYSLIKPYSEDADIAADAANWLEHFREIEVTEDNLTEAVRFVLAFPPGRFWLLSRKSFDIPLDSWLMSVFKNKLSSSMLRFLLDELMAPKDSATCNSIMGHMEAMKEYEESQKADEYEEKLRETGEGREPGAPESGMTERGASCPANKNMIVDEAPRGPLFDATAPGSSALPQTAASSGSVARAARVPSSGGEASREVPAVGGSDQGPSRQPAQRGKALKALCAAVLVLAVAIVASAGYARWHDQREREEHEAHMASLERLDRGELEAAIAANAEINEAFIKAELVNGQRADVLDEDVEILSIDLEDGDLVSGWVNAVCTVRGLESGTVYEVDLGLRDDGVVKHVFGYMVADER